MKIKEKRQPTPSEKVALTACEDVLCHLAFDSTLQASVIFIASSGKIIMANGTACKLLGYSKMQLLATKMDDIFDTEKAGFKELYKKGLSVGEFKDVVTVQKKNGNELTCKIASATFLGDHNIKKAVATLEDMSKSIRSKKNDDLENQKQMTAAVSSAQSSSDAAVSRLGHLEQKLDKEITINQRLQSSSRLQRIVFKKELDEKINLEIQLKKNQIAEAIIDAKELERADIGKELHDNVNQLLSATRLYLDMAKKDGVNREMYLDRSSEYTLNAIEEIRKLTKGLTADAIKNFGLYESIRDICKDTMEVNPIKISYRLDLLIENKVNDKFKLNVYRIMQEQLNNILKHSKATEVKISLSQNKKSIILSVADNGVGFDTGKKQEGIGIANIKSRSKSYNGRADFVSKPGQGCVLTVQFPAKDELLNLA